MSTDPGLPVVVGVDGSDHALRAVRWAADEAARRAVPLRLVSAFGWTDDEATASIGPRFRESLRAQFAAALETAAQVAREHAAGAESTAELRSGDPIGVLADESQRAGLLVIGDRGLGRVASVVAGSVGVAMAAHSACPVVVVRGAQTVDPSAPIVLGIDGNPNSVAAVAFAFQAATERSVPVVAAYAWWDTYLDQSPAALFRDEDQAAAEAQLAERLAAWVERYPQVETIPLVVRDQPARLLLAQSHRAQLVVVGTRGHGELAGLVLGSVSNALVHEAACPVAIVRVQKPAARPTYADSQD